MYVTHLTLPLGFSPRHPAIKIDYTMTYVPGSYRSRQPSSTQMINFKIQPDSGKSSADRADIQWSGFLATALTQYLSQRHTKRHFSKGSCFLPFKTLVTGQSPGDKASWRAVWESQVTVHSHSTVHIQRSLWMAEYLSCSQFKDSGLMCREKINGLRNRIMEKRLRYYINNCVLLIPKGRAIKVLTRTKRARISLDFALYCDRLTFCFSIWLFSSHFVQEHTPLKTMPARVV